MPKISALIELSRIDRFAGTMILFWPFAWSVTMSANRFNVSIEDYTLAILSVRKFKFELFMASNNLALGGGCIWNDIIDMDLDALVERTKHRPLPSGRLTVAQALVFLSMHIFILFFMSLHLNNVAWKLAFLTVVPLTGLYPFMKRITYLPQAWLGITLNTPVLIASTIFTDELSTAAIVLAAGGWCWTMWYDTIYGSQDKKDDVKAGVKSIVLLLHRYTWSALLAFSLGTVMCWIISGIINGSGAPYFAISAGGGGLLLARDLLTMDLDDPKSCLRAFESNGFLIGPIVYVGCLLDYLL